MKKITFDLDIYSYQIDSIDQVHNTTYINWMEIGRLKMLDAVGLSVTTLIAQGSHSVLAQTIIAYKAPLFLSDRVWVEMWLSNLGYSSVMMQFQFFNAAPKTKSILERIMVAEGYQRSLLVNKDSCKTRRFTREEKDAFLPYVEIQPIDDLDLLPKSPHL
jgi:acyl-CoA thioester hydrolase